LAVLSIANHAAVALLAPFRWLGVAPFANAKIPVVTVIPQARQATLDSACSGAADVGTLRRSKFGQEDWREQRVFPL
jgi:hypothetical protein